MRLLPFPRRSNRWLRQVDAYIDGRVTPIERDLLEARMEEQPSLREVFVETAALKSSLRAMPGHAAPRSFALTPAMISEPQKGFPGSGLVLRLGQATSGLAIAGLAALFVADLSGAGTSPASTGEEQAYDTSAGAAVAEDAPTIESMANGDDSDGEAAPAGGDDASRATGEDGSSEPADSTFTLAARDSGGDEEQFNYPALYAVGAIVVVMAAGAWLLAARSQGRRW